MGNSDENLKLVLQELHARSAVMESLLLAMARTGAITTEALDEFERISTAHLQAMDHRREGFVFPYEEQAERLLVSLREAGRSS